jgi:peptide/nickel transport system permease protein
VKEGLVRVAQRLLAAVVTVFAITTFAFWVSYVLPGDPARLVVGPQASEKDAAAARHDLGLDRPVVSRYGLYLAELVHPGREVGAAPHAACSRVGPVHVDLGFSPLYRKPVAALILDRLPVTLELALFALSFQLLFGLGVGFFAAARQGRWPDRLGMALALVLATLPTFVTGLSLQYVFGHRLGAFPLDGLGTGGERISSFVLPSLALGLFGAALFARVSRAELADALASDSIRTARAKGAGRLRVVAVHALRIAAAPITTLAVLDLGALVGGAVVVEKLFRLPGVGELSVNAVQNRDSALITGTALVGAITIVGSTMLADALGWLVDPRLRNSGSGER